MRGHDFKTRNEVLGVTATSEPWVAALAHELREPLNSVMLWLGALAPACAADSEAQGAAAAALRGTHHMARVIDDVLDLYRCILGKESFRTERVDLASLITSALDIVRPVLDAGGRRLTVLLPSTPTFIRAHPSRFRQVLTNLLSNAAKHTRPGGTITLSCELCGPTLVIRVRDDGAGIAPDELPCIFDLYRQGGGAKGGLGIGLAIVKRFIELHGGRVEARSAGLGCGSEFVVSLPAEGATPTTSLSTEPTDVELF